MSATTTTDRRSAWIDVLWLLAWGAAGSLYCATAAPRLSATFDEPLYVKLGLEHWRTGSTFGLMRVGTMPLPVDATTLPVYVWERLRGEPFDPAADLDRILPVARLGNLVFWWILLGYGGLAARRLGGPWAGRLAVAALACEPNLLAHAGLATTDLAVTAMILVFCVHYRAGREGTWKFRVGIPAICYALAILTKASALAFVPICMVAIEFEHRWGMAPASTGWLRLRDSLRGVFSRRNASDGALMAGIALALVFLYCGCDWQAKPKFVDWAHSLPDGTKRTAAVWFAEHLRIFNNAGIALWRQTQHNMQGHSSYLLGDWAPRAFWYYFPVALTIKTATPLLVLPLLVSLVRRRNLFNWACLAAFALLVFSLNCRVQIGIRLVLPLVALAVVGLSAALVRSAAEMSAVRRRALAGLACVGIAWMAASAASVWPDGLRYTNDLWGGTRRGYRLLSDSNYDWGQGLKELAAWQSGHADGPIDVWYFGTDPASQKPPFRVVPLHDLPIANEAQLREHLQGRYFAVGTTVLYGSYCNDPRQKELLDGLRKRRPAARIGTFLIYDLKPEFAATTPLSRTAAH